MSLFLDQPFNYGEYIGTKGPGEWKEDECSGVSCLQQAVLTIDQMRSEGRGLIAGIFGGWGTGKTSLLRGLESYYKESKGMPVLFFEAWRYQGDRGIECLTKIREQLKTVTV